MYTQGFHWGVLSGMIPEKEQGKQAEVEVALGSVDSTDPTENSETGKVF